MMRMQLDDRTDKRQFWREPVVLTVHPDVERAVKSDWDQLAEEEEESLWRVIIHNDEVTPMEFVVMVLQRIFELLPLQAEHVMFVAHYTGMAYVCTLPLSEAQARVGKAHFAAQLEGYPLRFTIEPE